VTDAKAPNRSGLLYAFAAYGVWGFLPLYFLLLKPAGAFEVVAWRIVFSLAFCAVLITAMRAWPALVAILRQPRLLLTLGLAAVLIYVNWQVYVYGTLSGQVIETSLGYFINPIVTVLLGVLLLHERLRRLQWIAVGISVVAVVIIVIGNGGFPWIAITLACSFGLYGLLKKRVGPQVDALSGLAIESAWLLPVAIVQLAVVGATAGITFGTAGPVHGILLVVVGVATAIPLLLFASASRRLPLVTIGLIQFLTPVIQFIIGYVFLHEAMPAAQWIGFGCVWLALLVLSIDLIRRAHSQRGASALPA
jgi:chloramphenicol-sensitive protein RarD